MGIDILGVDIMGVDILGTDILVLPPKKPLGQRKMMGRSINSKSN